MTQVLFVCVHNAARSQMAEAYFNALAPAGMRAVSAGTVGGANVSDKAIAVMAEIGVDMSDARSKQVTEAMVRGSDRVITMGCGVEEACPVFLGTRVDEDWALANPKGKPVEEVRVIRDEIRRRVEDLIRRLAEASRGRGGRGA